jgi:uncharacterized protein
MEFTADQKTLLLRIAREAIASRLALTSSEEPLADPALAVHAGAFVTLHLDGNLRGCIGRIVSDDSLISLIREMAQAAAFSDPRFPPLGTDEFRRIVLEISVLSPPEPVADIQAIRPGTHGLIIRRGGRSGLLLPQVATEYGWDRDTFLSHTCMKAGLPADAWKTGDCELLWFTATVFGENT